MHFTDIFISFHGFTVFEHYNNLILIEQNKKNWILYKYKYMYVYTYLGLSNTVCIHNIDYIFYIFLCQTGKEGAGGGMKDKVPMKSDFFLYGA